MARRKTLVTYLIAYFFTIATALRYLSLSGSQPEKVPSDIRWALALSLAAFFMLLVFEPWLSRRSPRYTHLYLVVQSVIVSIVSLLTPGVDYFSALFLSLILQAMLVFPLGIGLRWLAVLTIIMAALMLYGHPFSEGLPLVIIMSVANVFIGSYAAVTREAESARAEAEAARKQSQELYDELQDAHEQLRAYAAQAEELAVTSERNRLARDLHDSVTQSLYSLTLFTQAAHERAEAGDLERVTHTLARIADTARRGLKEMRLLVYELRPLALETEGLVGALRQRLEMVEGRSGLQTRLLLEPDEDIELPAHVEKELYRIAQEALNNALKHAHATSVTVRLAVTPALASRGAPVEPSGQVTDGQRIEFEVSDDGCGFDPWAVVDKGGMGLTSIRERAEGLRGALSLSSAPGQGTTLKVDVYLSNREITP
jgi:signal transduction histidine kinase